jgi:hypothetical protein
MAAVDVIATACSSLEEKLLELRLMVDVFGELAGDQSPPPWLFVVQQRVAAVDVAAQTFASEVYRHAMPHLRDLASVSSGGMGAVAPMGTRVVAGELAASRK